MAGQGLIIAIEGVSRPKNLSSQRKELDQKIPVERRRKAAQALLKEIGGSAISSQERKKLTNALSE